MRTSLCSSLAVALIVTAASVCPAQETTAGAGKPLVTVSIAGYDALKGHLDTIGKLGGNPALAQGLEGYLKAFTQGKELVGLDKARPWGAVVLATGAEQSREDLKGYAFVPVTDLKQLMGAIPNAPAAGADGVFELKNPNTGETGYAKQQGKWAYVVKDRELFKSVAADPSLLLGDLVTNYAAAVRISAKNLPPALRKQMVDQIETGFQAAQPQMPNEDDAAYAARVNVAKQSVKKIIAFLDDLDDVVFGANLDAKSGAVYLEASVTARPGTKTAAQMAQVKDGQTDYAGFALPGAALVANCAGTMSDDDVAQNKANLADLHAKANKELDANGGLTPDQVKVAKELLADLFDVAEKTLETKKSDGGLALCLEPQKSCLVAGGAIAEGGKLDKALKKLVAEVGKDEPDLAKNIKLDAETVDGVHFHVFSMPTPKEEMARVVGQTLEVVVGVGEKTFYIGAGHDVLKTIKQVIADSKSQAGKTIPPMKLVLSGGAIAKFAASMTEGQVQMMATMLAGELAKAGGKDHATLTATPIANGVKVRLEFEEGLIKLIGTASKMMGPGAPGGGMPPAQPSPF